jgi:hypothetical protein
VTNEFDFRVCVNALKNGGQLPAWMLHYQLDLYDCLDGLSTQLYGTSEGVVPTHERTIQHPVHVRHGLHYALQHQSQQLVQAGTASGLATGNSQPAAATVAAASQQPEQSGQGESAAQWISRRLGSHCTLRARRSAADVQQLLQLPLDSKAFLSEPAALATHAMVQGVLMFPAAAAMFARSVVVDTAAWQLLQRQQYEQLQRRLRDAPLALDMSTAAAATRPAARGGQLATTSDTPATTSAGMGVGQVQLQPAEQVPDTTTAAQARAADLETAAECKRRAACERQRKRRREARAKRPPHEMASEADQEQRKQRRMEQNREAKRRQRAREAGAALAAGATAAAVAAAAHDGVA